MRKVNWGILSTSNFALTKVIPALLKCDYVNVSAISSRDLSKAQAAARQFGIAKAYGSYEDLLADPEIEIVYNPTPNHLHVPWSIKALMAGKHVLCEKPIGLSSTEAQQLLAVSKKHPKLKIMEAFMYRFHPQWRAAKRLVEEGGIGELRTIHSFFSYFNVDEKNVRNQAEIGSELADCCSSIGIIERGQLLMHGPIEDVYRRIRG
ncbi:MAG: Gfo/Idh/MocA family oxidoreductase, partial [Acidobacteria bacterium]|nr:Gfo/Idh/MocA family oxidoreductase [Acidobacteriota bacterium]